MTVMFDRHSGITPPVGMSATIIGCGSVGSNAALIMASLGVHEMVMIDGDTWEDGQQAASFLPPGTVGANKAQSLSDFMTRNFRVNARAYPNFVREADRIPSTDIMLCAPDSNEVRSFLFQKRKPDIHKIWLDARMGGEHCTLYTITDQTSDEELAIYSQTFTETTADLACGARAWPILTKGILPAMIGNALHLYVRGQGIFEQRYNGLIGGIVYSKGPFLSV